MTEERIKRFASILSDMGQVMFASILIEPLINNSFNSVTIVVGSALALLAWFASLLLSKTL